MAYTKQSFTDHVKDANGNVVQRGTTLKKEHLDHMEDGIFQAHEQLARKLSAPASPQVGDYLRIKSIAADGTMVVEGVPAPEAALPERPTFRDVSLVPQSDQNAGATLVPEGTAEQPKVGLYGCHGNEPVELCNVAEATADQSAPNLAQVREMISAATNGTIVPAGTVTLTENGDYDVTQYANAEVAIPEVTQALPEITVNQDTGKIGYTITQEEGYVAGGTQYGTIQQPAQAAKTVTPGVADKVAVAKGRYVTGDIVVVGDPNLDSKNIRKNATIFGIPGGAPEVVEAESLNAVHQWEKYSVGEEVVETEKANEWLTTKSTGGIGSTTIEFRYADEFKVEDGSIVLVGATITSITDANKSAIVGKYIYVANKGYYRVPADATVTYSEGTYGESIIVSKVYQLSLGEVRTLIGVVLSEDIEAYPEDGEQDGYWYVYIGTLENTGNSGGGAGYVVSDTPPEDTNALWVDTSEPEEAVALGVTAVETADGVDLYCTDELGTTKVSLRHGNGSGTVLVAASDAPDIIKAAARYVCSGVNDQMTINAAIQAVGKGEVRLAGGNYYLTGEIVLADDITIAGKNAILNVCDEISSTITQAYTSGDTVIHVADTSKFLVGQKVSTDAKIASEYPCHIIDIDDDALTVTLDTPLHGTKGFDANSYRLIADFTVLPCEGLTNVVIDGLVLNCNGGSYGYYDTAFGGNGILFYQANRCTAKNCTVNEAQNHGILTTSSEQCHIINCVTNDCERLGIDTFSSSDSGGHLIHGCTAKGCNIGFQLHNAVNTVVSNCFSIDNSVGISAQEHPENLIITGNVVKDCGYSIKCIASGAKMLHIIGNTIIGGTDGVQLDATGSTDCCVSHNKFKDTGRAINLIGVNGFSIVGNHITNPLANDTTTTINGNAAINISGTAKNGYVADNHIIITSTDAKGCGCGIIENKATCDYNVVVNNVVRGARIAATQKLGENSKFENNYEFA